MVGGHRGNSRQKSTDAVCRTGGRQAARKQYQGGWVTELLFNEIIDFGFKNILFAGKVSQLHAVLRLRGRVPWKW